MIGKKRSRDAEAHSPDFNGRLKGGPTPKARLSTNVLGILVVSLAVIALGAWRLLPSAGEDASQPPASPFAELPTSAPTPDTLLTNPPDASFAPDVAIVERDIVDRPGVPASLYDKYWAGGGQVGQVGTTARLVLPKDEGFLATDAGRVASYIVDPETSRPTIGPDGAKIIVREIRTGVTLRTFDAPVQIAYGLMAGTLLFWTGRTLPGSLESTDAGVWVIDLGVVDSSPKAVIPPSDLAEQYGADAVRGPTRLTDNGRTIVTLVQSPTRRGTDIIDVENLTLRQTLLDMYALEVLDGVALVIPIHGDEGDTASRMQVIDLASGVAVGPGVPTDEVAWAYAANNEFYVQHSVGAAGYQIVALDIRSGSSRELASKVTLDLSHGLSAPGSLVLTPPAWDVGIDGKVHQPITIIDPVTGHIEAEGFEIGNP